MLILFSDINECLMNVCPENSYCENTLGGFTCSCEAGFTSNGSHCLGKATARSERTIGFQKDWFYGQYSYLGQSMQFP